VVGEAEPEATAAIERIARERAAPLVHASDGVEQVRLKPDTRYGTYGSYGSRIRLRTPAHDYGEVTLALPGQHQIGNAIVAVRVLEVLARNGMAVPPQAIVEGLTRVKWPGR